MKKVYHPGFLSAIGCIPFLPHWRHLRNSPYAEYVRRKLNPRMTKFLLIGLFRTGNQPPPNSIFNNVEAFRAYLCEREYRGALTLHDMVIEIEDGKLIFEISHLPGWSQIGYTAFPILWDVFWIRRFFPFWKGETDEDQGYTEEPSVSIDERELVIAIISNVKFRIGKNFRRLIEQCTGREPPFLWMQLECYFDLKADAGKVRALGTAVPSQWFRWATHRDGVIPVKTHDMVWHLSLEQVQSVFDCDSDTASRSFRTPWIEANLC